MADSVSVWLSPECEVHVFSSAPEASSDPLPFVTYPPHTRRERTLASLDRGENRFGDLRDEFYVLTNNGYDPTHFVLWSGDSGFQHDDDRPRLTPVVYIRIAELPEFDEPEDLEYAASLALLCAWIRIVSEAEWGDYEIDTSPNKGTLPEEVIKKLLEIGNSSERLDLHALLS